jgi:hypothetical protein
MVLTYAIERMTEDPRMVSKIEGNAIDQFEVIR